MILLTQSYIILCICLAIIFLIKPILFKQYISFIKVGKRYYIQGILKLTFGTLLLMVASQTKLFWLFAILGLWGLLEGIILFIKPDTFKSMGESWLKRSDRTIRFFFSGGVIACGLMFLGTL
jgi:uncharacterized protein YjeT (DUF2065 family)